MVELLKSSALTGSSLAANAPAVDEGEFRRLERMLGSGDHFRLIFAQFNDLRVRAEVIRRVAQVAGGTLTLALDHERFPEFHVLEDTLADKAPHYRVIHLVDVERWLNAGDRERLITWFNYRREKLAERFPVTLVLWLLEPTVKAFAMGAPDFWAWREGVLDFNVSRSSDGLIENVTGFEYWERASLPREKKIKRIDNVRRLLETDRDLPSQIRAQYLRELGGLYQSLGDYPAALRNEQQSLSITREIVDRAGEAETLNNISQICKVRGDYETALKYLEKSLKIFQEINDQTNQGVTLNNISRIYYVRGDYEMALKYLEESLTIFHDIADLPKQGVTLNNISQIYKAQDNYGMALKCLEESLMISRKVGNRVTEGATLNNIAVLYHAQGDFETALKYLGKALKIRREIGDLEGEGSTLNNISQIYKIQGDDEAALRHLEQSLTIRREIGDIAGMCPTLFNIGHIRLRNQKPEQAITAWVSAYSIAKKLDLAEALKHLDKLAKELGGPGLEFWEQLAAQHLQDQDPTPTPP